MKKIDKLLSQYFIVMTVVSAMVLSGCGNDGTQDRPLAASTDEITVYEREDTAAGTTEISDRTNEVPDGDEGEEQNEINTEPEETDPAVLKLESMTLDEKIWQMMIVTPGQLTKDVCITDTTEVFLDCLKEKPAGGIMYFGANLVDREQTLQMTGNAMDFGLMVEGLPLFLCIDEEGGRVARIGCREQYNVPRIGAMAKIKSREEAYAAGETIGEYLSELGFNFDLAPDADVLTNSANEAIGDRAFSSDPQIVSDFAGAFSDGLHKSGVLSCYKHFPGHGGVTGDTHNGFIATDKTLEELLDSELIPFYEANDKNIDCIMVAHISAPMVTGDNTPASLSYELITEILKNKLGYKGLIMTDALNMSAVNDFSQGDAAVMAILAGADLILEPSDIDQAFEGIKKAVEDDRITENRIDESVLKIINAKINLMGE